MRKQRPLFRRALVIRESLHGGENAALVPLLKK